MFVGELLLNVQINVVLEQSRVHSCNYFEDGFAVISRKLCQYGQTSF